ncbi:MAG TPA: CvpA family protein [Gaiellaceae bacterium]|jgi:uncharacterized membrane protein required for colicin V production
MTNLDWVLIAFVVLTGLSGYKRGLIVTILSLIGLVVGAIVGARVAPHLLSSHTRYTALIGLVGSGVGIAVFEVAARIVGRTIRGGLHLLPPLHLLDSLGGAVIGALWGLALVWVASAVALQIPGHAKLRKHVRHSHVVRRLDKIAPPHDLLHVQKQLVRFAAMVRSEHPFGR